MNETVNSKTLTDWINTLPRIIRKKAFNNAHVNRLNLTYPSLDSALSDAFHFDQTPEGRDYWNQVYYKILMNEKL